MTQVASGRRVNDEHFNSLGELLGQLRLNLAATDNKKGTYSDYLRLLQFYRETHDQSVRNIVVQWVETEERDPVE